MRLDLGHHRLKRIAVFVLDAGHRSCEFSRMGSHVVDGESKAAYLHMIAIEQIARRCRLCFNLHEQVFLPRSRVCLCQDSEARQPVNRFFSCRLHDSIFRGPDMLQRQTRSHLDYIKAQMPRLDSEQIHLASV